MWRTGQRAWTRPQAHAVEAVTLARRGTGMTVARGGLLDRWEGLAADSQRLYDSNR